MSQGIRFNKLLGGTLLVTGTCIGAGMLGLPVATAAGGFVPSLGVFILVWALMIFTGLVMLEVSLYFDHDVNLISMARATMGNWGAKLAWITLVLFLYSLLAAYTASGSALVHAGFASMGAPVSLSWVMLGFATVFAAVVYLGAHFVDYCNRLLIIGLLAAYFTLIFSVFPHVQATLLHDGEAKYLFAASPLIVTAFGFHLLIPSLKTYLQNHVATLRWAIILGSTLPLLVYILWQVSITGVIPTHGPEGLNAMYLEGEPVVPMIHALDTLLGSSVISDGAKLFVFFAIVSSYMGVALGLFDFFADALKIKKQAWKRIFLLGLTFLPPLVFALYYPEGFIMALGYAGFFAVILLILYPAFMAFRGRQKSLAKHYQVAGGSIALGAAMLAGLFVILMEVLNRMQLLPLPHP